MPVFYSIWNMEGARETGISGPSCPSLETYGNLSLSLSLSLLLDRFSLLFAHNGPVSLLEKRGCFCSFRMSCAGLSGSVVWIENSRCVSETTSPINAYFLFPMSKSL